MAAFFAVAGQGQSVDPEEWQAIETRNFTIFTDSSAERGLEIAMRLEQFRSVFARLAPSLDLQSPAPTTLFAFKDAESFAPFKARADRGRARTLGQFTRTRDGNYLTLDASASMVGAFSVLYHEYVHFLATNNLANIPLWFNEGLAEYYSTFDIDGDRAVLGLPVERHVKWLKREGDLSLDELIAVDSAGAAAHGDQEVGRFYALSWLLVHYLMSGGEQEVDAMVDYFLRLGDGEDPERAFERAFDRRMSTISDELRTYLAAESFPSVEVNLGSSASAKARGRAMSPADALYHLGDLSLHLRKRSQAERLFQMALDAEPQHGDSLAGLGHLRDLSSRFSEAEVYFSQALAGKPRRVISYLHHGRHALAVAQGGGEGAEQQARRAAASLSKALDLFPSFGEAHGLLARAQALPGGNPEKALASILKARKLLPQRLDWVAHHVQILVRLKRFDAAESMLRNQLEVRSDDFQLIDGLWEDLDRVRLLTRAEKAFEAGDINRGLELFDEAVSLTTDLDLRIRLEKQLETLRARAEVLKASEE